MKLQTALDEFLLAGEADGKSPATLKWYRSQLGLFVRRFGNRDIETISTRQLREYIVSLRRREHRYLEGNQQPVKAGGLSEESINTHIRTLHAFFNWMVIEYSLSLNPMRRIQRPRQQKPVPKAISPQDFIKIFEVTHDTDAGRRDRAILAMLADSGCRLSGLLSLTLENYFPKEGRAIVTEKGKTRVIRFTDVTARLIALWIEVRVSESSFIFTSMNDGSQLTESGVHELLKRLKRRANVKGRVNPHSFRHAFAREYIRNGGDIATLARLMGHEDISTTFDFYAVFSENELDVFHRKYSPFGKSSI